MAVFSLLSENLGKGITIKNNKLDLNTNNDFVWTGKNFFTKQVIFSTEQVFPIKNLSHDNTALGSIISSNGNSWQILPPGQIGQTLVSSTRGIVWSNINLNDIHGILPLSKGGTGWGKFPYNGILFNSGNELLDLLPMPSGRKVLFSDNGSLLWEDISNFTKDILLSIPKEYEINKNKFIFKKENPVFQIKDVISGGLHLNKNQSLHMSINHTDFDNNIQAFPTSSIVLNNENKNNLFEIYTNINNNIFESVFSIDSLGNITKGNISSNQIIGIFDISKGGTGINVYESGDILFAKSNNELGKLSTLNSEGYILKVINGIPKYVPHDKTDFDGNFELPVKFAQPKNNLPSITLSKGELINTPNLGSLEFDGDKLYLTTNSDRKVISFLDSDILGLSENIRGILSLKNGGTGADLSEIKTGQIIFKDNHGLINGLDTGDPGKVLVSMGEGNVPQWKHLLNDINSQENLGINIDKNDSSLDISINLTNSFNPNWQGNHTFSADLYINNSQIILSTDENLDKAPIKFNKSKSPKISNDGEIWFDGKDLIFATSGKNINITKVDEAALPAFDYVPSHYLTLGAGSEVLDGRKIRMKVPVPFLVSKGSLVHAKWRVRRLEITLDEPPQQESAIFKLYSNNKIILNYGMIGENRNHLIIDSFDENFVETGEMLQIECVKSGGSNFWSIFLLIDLI